MTNNSADLLTNFFQQTRAGKMSLITLIQNLSDKELSSIPEVLYNANHRYVENHELKGTFPSIEDDNKSINDQLQQRITSILPSSSIERRISKLSIEERYQSIAMEFNFSSTDIEKQYKLALKNRIEIPPILMRRIILDAIGILHMMMNELNEDTEKVSERFQRISKHVKELEIYNKLFDRHC